MNINDFSSNLNLPAILVDQGNDYFGAKFMTDARKLLMNSRTSLSFTKGSPETYYIVTGIVKDNRSHESKIVYKKRLEGTEEGPMKSNCDCHIWTETGHCPHVATLFLTYHLKTMTNSANENLAEDLNIPTQGYSSFGVVPPEYGIIINGPAKLQGASPTSVYSSLQYKIENGKVINFPLPEQMNGELVIHIDYPRDEDNQPLKERPPILRFEHHTQKENGETRINKKISIFENLYIFDWVAGQAWHLSAEQKELLQKIRHQYSLLNANDLIHLCENIEQTKLYIQGTLFAEIPRADVHAEVSLLPGDRKNHLSFTLRFTNEKELLTPQPAFLKSFCFDEGLIGDFKRKKDAYDFIDALREYYENEAIVRYKTLLTGLNSKKRWLELIDRLDEHDNLMVYDQYAHHLFLYDCTFLKKFFASLISNFGPMSLRYSEFNDTTETITFEVPSGTVFTNLANFHQEVTPYGVNIFYNRTEIAKWNSRVRFERRSSITGWFDLELKVGKDDLEIIKNIDADNRIALTNKGLVLLTNEQKQMLKFMTKYMEYEKKQEIDDEEAEGKRFILPFKRARIFELYELKKFGIEGALTPEEEDLCRRLETMEEMPVYDIPENLQEIIRPYQATGYNWLRFLYENKLGACLADDMGLGKTLQTIAFIKSIYHKINKVLVVCPVSILMNWEKEIQKFSDMDVHIYHGGDRTIPDDKKIVLTSYGVMKREVDSTFSNFKFDILILDEVQHLKNIRSLGSYAARKIDADYRICLTGTPVENDLSEFYNILDLSVPGIWGDLQFIRTRSNTKSRLIARKTAAPFILRRTKSQVLTDLPPKIENNVYLNLTDGEKEEYYRKLNAVRTRITGAPSKSKYGEILKGLLELRQLCLWQKTQNIVSTKLDFLEENLEQIMEEGHQAIVFSQFTTYLDIIQKRLENRHWPLSRIDGSQRIKTRQTQVDKFQEGKSSIFLISLKAGGVGLNLTAASYVFLMDPWWNPAVENQAIDRAHRIGQKNTLTVYRPIIKESIEEKVLTLQEMKKQLFQDLLPEDDDSLFTGKLTMKDFESLFN